MKPSLVSRLAQLEERLAGLPEPQEPPPPTLAILGRSHIEQDWQRLLVHFLRADNSHGLGHDFLAHVLEGLVEEFDINIPYSRFDLKAVQIVQEVVTDAGRPDILIWVPESWFTCWELKIGAAEGKDQTSRYARIESFPTIDLDISDLSCDRRAYIYLAPDPEDRDATGSEPESNAFTQVSWVWIASTIQRFLKRGHGQYPERTTTQLREFVDTIHYELSMTEFQENQREKMELYIEHYEDIAAVESAFNDLWEEFQHDWGSRLASILPAATEDQSTGDSKEYAFVDLDVGEKTQRWVFRQGSSDWSWIFPREWWTNLEESEPIVETPKPNARVGFLHRLENDRDNALRDHELQFYLRNALSGQDDFYDGFAERFNSDDEILDLLPARTTPTGKKSNILAATYPIQVESHEDFFEAYVDALSTAIDEHVVSNPDLVDRIHHHYQTAVKNDVSL